MRSLPELKSVLETHRAKLLRLQIEESQRQQARAQLEQQLATWGVTPEHLDTEIAAIHSQLEILESELGRLLHVA